MQRVHDIRRLLQVVLRLVNHALYICAGHSYHGLHILYCYKWWCGCKWKVPKIRTRKNAKGSRRCKKYIKLVIGSRACQKNVKVKIVQSATTNNNKTHSHGFRPSVYAMQKEYCTLLSSANFLHKAFRPIRDCLCIFLIDFRAFNEQLTNKISLHLFFHNCSQPKDHVPIQRLRLPQSPPHTSPLDITYPINPTQPIVTASVLVWTSAAKHCKNPVIWDTWGPINCGTWPDLARAWKIPV